jgi:outer membrane protein assembly factor BamD (BamD/ComL family)
MRLLDAGDVAEELLIRIQERLPGSRLAELAGIELADYYFARRKMDLAAEMYSIFLQNNPRSEFVSKARRRLIYAHLASFKGP